MPQAHVEDERDFGAGKVLPFQVIDPTVILQPAGNLGSREDVERELDLIAAAIRMFHSKHPDQVMKECSAYTARLTELCVLLYRVEGQSRQYTRLRTQQVQRFIEELDRQFKVASRLVEISRQDIALMGGQP